MKFYTPTFKECQEVCRQYPEFRQFGRDGFHVFDYMISGADTWEHPASTEMRGIAFCSTTHRIISRPLHKFFNLGERDETLPNRVDLSKPHNIELKLDGSMIRVIKLQGRDHDMFRLGTRAGITDISMMAEVFVAQNRNYSDLIRYCMSQDVTAIFEFCSRKNRVVIDHPVDRLVLLAVRDNSTGSYLSRSEVAELSNRFCVEHVSVLEFGTDIESVRKVVSAFEGEEGVVVTFDTGFKVKIKGDDYVLKHGALDGLRSTHRVIEMIISNKVDDVIPLIDDNMASRLKSYSSHVLSQIGHTQSVIERVASEIWRDSGGDRKSAASIVLKDYKTFAHKIFACFDGKKPDFISDLDGASNRKISEVMDLCGIQDWASF